MSFLQKAREAAEKAAEEARHAAERVSERASDPATAEAARARLAGAGKQARQAAGLARKGLTSVIERIDPGLLADVIVKATALQEKANAALRAKRSPYRIAEVVITAAIPPQVSFSVARIGELSEEAAGDERSSSELLATVIGGAAEPVLALDGSMTEESGEAGDAQTGPAEG